MDISAATRLFRPLAPYKAAAVAVSFGAVCVLANSILNKRAVRGKKKASTWDWDKEVVVVTGGSGGIGSEIVDGFAKRGVTVVSLDIKPPRPDESDYSTLVPGSNHKKKLKHRYQVDVTCRDAIRDVAQRIRSDLGADPTVLINNAGIAIGRPILDLDEQSVRAVMDVNLLSHFWAALEFVPAMVSRDHGHVVSIASVASFVTLSSNVEYSCAKVGVHAFHEGLRQDLRHRYGTESILTSIVYSYWVRTPLIQNLTAHPSFNAPLLDPRYVAESIVTHVMRGDGGGEIYLPWYAQYLAGLRGWPMWLQEMYRDAMAGFLKETSF